jgi:hypothetical protein
MSLMAGRAGGVCFFPALDPDLDLDLKRQLFTTSGWSEQEQEQEQG